MPQDTTSGIKTDMNPAWLARRLDAFFGKRQPCAKQVTLRQKTLLILPTRFGGAMLLLVVLLYVLGSNYQNNLIILLAFFLLSLLLSSCWLAFRQLHGITLAAGPTQRGFANETLTTYITLNQGRYPRVGIMLTCAGQQIELDTRDGLVSDIKPQSTDATSALQHQHITLQFTPQPRGYYALPKIIIATCAPFGLVRCWSQVELQQHYWRYPARLPPTRRSSAHSQDADLPDQIQAYTAGTPLKQLLWKRLAQMPDRPLVRVFSSEQHPDDDVWFIVDAAEGAEREQQLSQFCELILSLPSEQRFGVKTPQHELSVSHGPQQQQRALEYLSLCP